MLDRLLGKLLYTELVVLVVIGVSHYDIKCHVHDLAQVFGNKPNSRYQDYSEMIRISCQFLKKMSLKGELSRVVGLRRRIYLDIKFMILVSPFLIVDILPRAQTFA